MKPKSNKTLKNFTIPKKGSFSMPQYGSTTNLKEGAKYETQMRQRLFIEEAPHIQRRHEENLLKSMQAPNKKLIEWGTGTSENHFQTTHKDFKDISYVVKEGPPRTPIPEDKLTMSLIPWHQEVPRRQLKAVENCRVLQTRTNESIDPPKTFFDNFNNNHNRTPSRGRKHFETLENETDKHAVRGEMRYYQEQQPLNTNGRLSVLLKNIYDHQSQTSLTAVKGRAGSVSASVNLETENVDKAKVEKQTLAGLSNIERRYDAPKTPKKYNYGVMKTIEEAATLKKRAFSAGKIDESHNVRELYANTVKKVNENWNKRNSSHKIGEALDESIKICDTSATFNSKPFIMPERKLSTPELMHRPKIPIPTPHPLQNLKMSYNDLSDSHISAKRELVNQRKASKAHEILERSLRTPMTYSTGSRTPNSLPPKYPKFC